MAPEVQRNRPYGTTVDVYSLAIVMHQVLSLEPCPFDEQDEASWRNAVLDGYRPTVPETWPAALLTLMKQMWHEEPRQRPSAQSVAATSREMLEKNDEEQLYPQTMVLPAGTTASSMSWTRYWMGKN